MYIKLYTGPNRPMVVNNVLVNKIYQHNTDDRNKIPKESKMCHTTGRNGKYPNQKRLGHRFNAEDTYRQAKPTIRRSRGTPKTT